MSQLFEEFRARVEEIHDGPEEAKFDAFRELGRQRREALEALTDEELTLARTALEVEGAKLYIDCGFGPIDIVEPEDIPYQWQLSSDMADIDLELVRRRLEAEGDQPDATSEVEHTLTDDQLAEIHAGIVERGNVKVGSVEEFIRKFRENQEYSKSRRSNQAPVSGEEVEQ